MSFWKWSRTASSNATADGSINWAEGQAPSTVNDSARAMMAAAAKYRDDVSGAIVTTGGFAAFAVASYQAFDTLAHMDGAMIAFTPHVTNTAGPVTLNVDGLGAKLLRLSPSGAELPAGTLVQGTPYVATYYNATAEWILQGLAGNPYNIPLGGMIEFTGTTAPNGSFVLPSGQAISRTTYATYFAMVGTTYGAGDGSTTFNVIDKRGRVSAGKDDMGGSAASRLTATYFGTSAAALGAAGGAESLTIAQANVPNYNLSLAGLTVSGSVPVNGRVNGIGSTNEFLCSDGAGGGVTQTPSIVGGTVGGTLPIGGSGTPASKVQPTIIVNYLLRVL
jgi:microcystin-dependent protein